MTDQDARPATATAGGSTRRTALAGLGLAALGLLPLLTACTPRAPRNAHGHRDSRNPNPFWLREDQRDN